MEIGVWGDSIVYGAGDSEGLGWVGRLRRSFSVDEEIGVYNRGVCGDTSADVLKRFAAEAKSIQPDKVIFAVGANDLKYPRGASANNVSLKEFEQNMRELIVQARRHTEHIYIVGATNVNGTFVSDNGSRFINTEFMRYSGILKRLAQTERLAFIDVSEALDLHNDLSDGLHPNAAGYEKLFTAIAPVIK